MNVAGFLLAGRLADAHPMYLPLAALLARSVSLGFCVFLLEGGAVSLSYIADSFFTTFFIVFLIWGFLRLSARMERPALWAGMGRIVELPCGAAGALLGVVLMQRLPVASIFGIYVAMLIAAVAVSYQVVLMWHGTTGRTPTARERTIPPIPAVRAEDARTESVGAAAEKTESHAEDEWIFEAGAIDLDLRAQRETTEEIPAPVTGAAASLPDVAETNEDAGQIDAEASEPAEPFDAETNEILSPTFGMTGTELDALLRTFAAFYDLTRRETDVLRELLWRRSITEIAQRLAISSRTVKFHIGNLFRKTDRKTQKELRMRLRDQKRRFDKGLDPMPGEGAQGKEDEKGACI